MTDMRPNPRCTTYKSRVPDGTAIELSVGTCEAMSRESLGMYSRALHPQTLSDAAQRAATKLAAFRSCITYMPLSGRGGARATLDRK